VDGGFTAGSRWNVPAGSGVAAYEAWRAAGGAIPGFDTTDARSRHGEGQRRTEEAEGSS
jgi:hypothetical protein